MAVDKPSAPTPLPASEMNNNAPTLPPGFAYNAQNWLVMQPAGQDSPVKICSWLQVAARTRDPQGDNYGYLLHWLDDDNRHRYWAMPAELLAGDGSEYRRILLSRGMRLSNSVKARQLLSLFIQQMGELATQKAISVNCIGWHHHAYVHPRLTFYPSEYSNNPRMVLQTMHPIEGFIQQGSSDSWQQQVGRYCLDNPLLIVGVCASLAAPLLHLCGVDGFGLHLYGASSTGKTAALYPALSVWGEPNQLRHSWRATANSLEGTALAHNDALLALDEMGEVDPKEAGDVAYMLANGQGKTRAGKYGEMRLPARWRLVFLSTGEVTLESHLASIGKRVKAGQQVRVIDLSADAGAQMGVFNHSHGMNAADLADHLKQQSRQHYGSLALDWLKFLTQHSAQVRPVFQNVRQRFLATLPIEADGQVRRVAEKFALLASAGLLAIQAKVLDWPTQSVEAACLSQLNQWILARGGVAANEDQQVIRQVRSFIEQHGESRFTPKQTGYSCQVRQRAGWIDTGGLQTLYLFYPTGWREATEGLSPDRAAKALMAAGYLVPDGNRPQRKVSLPDNTRPRMYCVKGSILDD
jgi:putative DNA primase/helicase